MNLRIKLIINTTYVCCFCFRGVMPNQGCTNDSSVINSLAETYGNNSNVPGTGDHVEVTVELWVQEISKINELTSEFELDIYITETWLDPLLAFAHLGPCKWNISLDGGKWRDKFWNPNTCFVNSKKAKIHKSPFTNIFLMIVSEGVTWSWVYL